MRLINYKNGTHIDVIQWNISNLQDIKKFVGKCIDNYTVDISSDIDSSNVDQHYKITADKSLTIFLIWHRDVNVYRKYKVTISAHDFLRWNSTESLAKALVSVPKTTVEDNYGKLNMVKRHYISNQSGIHYACYQYNGTWTSIPGFLGDDVKCNGGYDIDAKHTFYIEYPCRNTLVIKPKFWFLIPVSDDEEGIITPNEPKVATSRELRVNFHRPKSVKLPKYVYTVTKNTGEYSDNYTQVVGTASTYIDAERIIQRAEKVYSIISTRNGDDGDLSNCPDFYINVNKTHGFNKHDFTN